MVSKNTIHIEKFKNDSSVLTTAKKKELHMIMFLNKETVWQWVYSTVVLEI